ncbi:MAG TPA: helix-turn-helix domain-containing protein [archaeon]|nr:helix-turn-helix domain-containing protein [archaeon]
MNINEIIETLREFGLSEYEAKTYSTLVFLGPSKAGEVSRESRVPQSKIYDILDMLTNRQLVEVLEGRPKEFKAVDPEVALENLVRNEEKKVKVLRAKASDVKKVFKKVNGNSSETTIEGIWTIKGRKYTEFFDKVAEMVDRSEEYIYGITRDFSKNARMSQSLVGCLKRGVKVKVVSLVPINEENYWGAKWYQTHGIQLKTFETKVHPRMVVVDGKELIMRLDHDPMKKENFLFTAVWSAHSSLVKVIDTYMKNLWNTAQPVNWSEVKPATTIKTFKPSFQE